MRIALRRAWRDRTKDWDRQRYQEAAVILPISYMVLWWFFTPEAAMQETALVITAGIVTGAIIPVMEFLWNLAHAPARLHADQEIARARLEGELAQQMKDLAYFRQELSRCLEKSVRPAEIRQSVNVPIGYKVASAAWLAQHPEIQKDLTRCRAEVEKLRAALAGIPSVVRDTPRPG